MSGTTPPKPVVETPPKPVAETPPKPVAETPVKPVAETPVKPVAETPAPVTDAKQSFAGSFLDYVRAVHRAYADAQKRSAETYEAYQREAREQYAELQKRVDDLQRDYVAGVQEAFGKDDATVRTEKAYQEMVGGYQKLVEEAQGQGDQLNKKLASLLNQQGEDLQKQFAGAFKLYLAGLRAGMQQVDDSALRVSDLEYLSQSIGTVAFYAGATGALAR